MRRPRVRKIKRKAIRWFRFVERPTAWVMMVGGLLTFISVLLNFIATGDAKIATLLVAADLTVSGFEAVQEAEPEEGEE